MQSSGKLYIGTSGIVVPGNKLTYPKAYQDKSRLAYYASLFNSVEINSTFRQIPRSSTFARWAQEVPPSFCFTLKLLKTISHTKPLAFNGEAIDEFVAAACLPNESKGCLLLQFPASINASYLPTIQNILQRLHAMDVGQTWQKAVEYRSTTWYNAETYSLLRRYGATLVLHDMPAANNLQLQETFPFYYYRYHGPTGDYRGSYTDDFLQAQADVIKQHLQRGSDVYVYFNNTMGQALENAQLLSALLHKKIAAR